jgi:hypothetical protein
MRNWATSTASSEPWSGYVRAARDVVDWMGTAVGSDRSTGRGVGTKPEGAVSHQVQCVLRMGRTRIASSGLPLTTSPFFSGSHMRSVPLVAHSLNLRAMSSMDAWGAHGLELCTAGEALARTYPLAFEAGRVAGRVCSRDAAPCEVSTESRGIYPSLHMSLRYDDSARRQRPIPDCRQHWALLRRHQRMAVDGVATGAVGGYCPVAV